jgi:Tol biopolymer transport system component
VKRLAAGVVSFVCLILVAAPATATTPGANGKIAFTRNAQVWLMNGDGTGQTLVADLESPSPDNFVTILSPAWSPDGTRLAFEYRVIGTSGPCEPEQFLCSSLVVMDVATGETETLVTQTGSPTSPSWSPDGTRVAFTKMDRERGSAIWVVDEDGTHVKRLTRSDRTAFGWSGDFDPTWSPDGARIAFTTSRSMGTHSWSIWTVETSRGQRVTKLMATDQNDFQPDWSPDGSKIAFVRTFPYPDYRVYTVSADGLVETEILRGNTPVELPKWSPDGTKIVYLERPREIAVMNADGSGAAKIADGNFPAWQPLP